MKWIYSNKCIHYSAPLAIAAVALIGVLFIAIEVRFHLQDMSASITNRVGLISDSIKDVNGKQTERIRQLEEEIRQLRERPAAVSDLEPGSAASCFAEVERTVGLPNPWIVLRVQNLSLCVHNPEVEFIAKTAYESKVWWSYNLRDIMINEVPWTSDAGIFFEVGTNIGTVAGQFARAEIPTITVEANPSNYALVATSQCFNRWRKSKFLALNKAIAREDDKTVYIQSYFGNEGIDWVSEKKAQATVAVSTIRIDSIMYQSGAGAAIQFNGFKKDAPVWGMKLDCEGCEGAALFSAEKLLKDPLRHPLVIHVEVTPLYLERGGVNMQSMYNFMKEAGYRSACPWYNTTVIDQAWYMLQRSKGHQFDCLFVKRRGGFKVSDTTTTMATTTPTPVVSAEELVKLSEDLSLLVKQRNKRT